MNEALGAKFLDEKVPGWEKEIDLDTLDLHDGCDCVLGQIATRRRWRKPTHATGFWSPWRTALHRLKIEAGTSLAGSFCGNTAAWKRLIRYRLRKQAA